MNSWERVCLKEKTQHKCQISLQVIIVSTQFLNKNALIKTYSTGLSNFIFIYIRMEFSRQYVYFCLIHNLHILAELLQIKFFIINNQMQRTSNYGHRDHEAIHKYMKFKELLKKSHDYAPNLQKSSPEQPYNQTYIKLALSFLKQQTCYNTKCKTIYDFLQSKDPHQIYIFRKQAIFNQSEIKTQFENQIINQYRQNMINFFQVTKINSYSEGKVEKTIKIHQRRRAKVTINRHKYLIRRKLHLKQETKLLNGYISETWQNNTEFSINLVRVVRGKEVVAKIVDHQTAKPPEKRTDIKNNHLLQQQQLVGENYVRCEKLKFPQFHPSTQ
ncbi:unnamed protein product [Paramecium octaurelia]|uniref:Uncharacterized protein n=1 Tax=Paramecium octaurelia TaxID=43137 RepID=A0A8S1WZQ3_PAROT|nr:unnamed protein product [Paramecium octaurelia]